jgi:hypothetical protein
MMRILRFCGPAFAAAALGWTYIGWRIWNGTWMGLPFRTSESPFGLILAMLIAGIGFTGSVLRLLPMAGTGAVLMFVFTIVGGFTIGGYYLPAVACFGASIACEALCRRVTRRRPIDPSTH